ncbi:MAG: hypothetical protein ABWX84_12420 [Nocardioides sp.]
MSTPRTPGKRVAQRPPSRRAAKREAPAPAEVGREADEASATRRADRRAGKPDRAARREPRRTATPGRRVAPPAPVAPQKPTGHGERVVEPTHEIAGTTVAGPVPAPDRRLRWLYVAGAVAVLLGLAGVVAAVLEVGPGWVDEASAILLSTTLTFALAARTGGRPFVFGGLALVFGVAAVVSDLPSLRGGAAVLTAVCAGVLGVMATVPAVRFRDAVREVLVALLIATVGGLAVVGFRPVVSLERYDYLTLALAFLLAIGLVFRLGAGLHGLGRRGLVVLLVGSIGLAVALAYAELLRRYGSQDVIDRIYDAVREFRHTAGAVPRPIQVLVGVPALVWGTHMRARRRQGWWVCAFGTAATVSVAGIMVNPATGWLEAGLIIVYSLVPGLVLGYLLIRIDLLFTGPRGRRARREEEATAIRPEPARLQPLL